MNLKNKNDADLIAEVKDLVNREKELVTQVLEYLKEVEMRRLYLARGYSSMFSFCTEYLKYSKDEAYMRIQAMRLLMTVPEVKEELKSGNISLTVLAQAQTRFRRDEKRRKSESLPALTKTEKSCIVKSLINTPSRVAEEKLATYFPETSIKPDKIKPVTEDKVRLEFTADKKLVGKIEKLKNLLAHKNYEGRLDLLFDQLADIAIERLERKTKSPDTKRLGAPQLKQTTLRSRFISIHTKRKVWERGDHQCQYVDPVTKKQCCSKHALQIDHIYEFAKGGSNNQENLRLLCASHNQFRNFVRTKASYLPVNKNSTQKIQSVNQTTTKP